MRSPLQAYREWARPRPANPEPVAVAPVPARNEAYTALTLLDALPPKARVQSYGAMMSSDFMACETVKARAMRSLPVHVMRNGDHGPERAPDHPLERVLRRPNSMMSWGDLVAWATIRRDVMGTAYIRAPRDPYTGTIRELRPVLGGVVPTFDRATGACVYRWNADRFNDAGTCREDEMLVVKTDASDDGGMTGRSLAELAAEDIGLSIDLVSFYRALLDNGNHFQGYLETDAELGVDDIEAIKASLSSTAGAENAGQIRIFDRGLKYREVSAKLENMSLVEQERFVLEKVCRVCHVDPHHVHADGTATATGAAGADIDFAKYTVLPEVRGFEEAFQVLLDRAASLGGKPSDFYVKFNMTGLERADIKTRMDAHRIAIYAGIYTRSHACELEEIPWLPGQDRLLQPTAYYMVDEDGEPYAPGPQTFGTSGQSDGVSGRDQKAVQAAFRVFVDDARDRIARRAAADGDCPKTRAYAQQVMRPVALAASLGGIGFDAGAEIDDEIGRSCWND